MAQAVEPNAGGTVWGGLKTRGRLVIGLLEPRFPLADPFPFISVFCDYLDMNPELPKPVKRALRELAGRAYEAELHKALTELSEDFERWKRGEIDSFELGERIHKFHDGPNRELYVRYSSPCDLRLLVGYAIHEHLIEQESVPEHVLPYLQGALSFYRDQERESSASG